MKRVLFALLALSSCTTLEGRYIKDPKLRRIEPATGISYYLTKPLFEVHRRTLHEGKPAKPVSDVVITAVPDYSRRFEVGMRSGLFSTDSIEVNLTETGVISSLSAESTNVAGKVVAGLVNLVAQIAKVAGGFALAAKPGQPPPPTEQDLLRATIRDAEKAQLITQAEQQAADQFVLSVFTDFPVADLTGNPDIDGFKVIAKKVLKHLSGVGKPGLAYLSVRQTLQKLDEAIGIPPPPLRDVPDRYKSHEQTVIKRLAETERLEIAVDALPTPESVAQVMTRLKRAVDVELAKRIAGAQNQRSFIKAVQDYKRAVKIILSADPLGRGLGERRVLLTEFLKSPLPAGLATQKRSAYEQFSKELRDVSAAISALIGSATPPMSPLPLATEVTSRISEDVHVVRFSERIGDPDTLSRQVRVARARVRFGEAKAAFIVHPLAPGD